MQINKHVQTIHWKKQLYLSSPSIKKYLLPSIEGQRNSYNIFYFNFFANIQSSCRWRYNPTGYDYLCPSMESNKGSTKIILIKMSNWRTSSNCTVKTPTISVINLLFFFYFFYRFWVGCAYRTGSKGKSLAWRQKNKTKHRGINQPLLYLKNQHLYIITFFNFCMHYFFG